MPQYNGGTLKSESGFSRTRERAVKAPARYGKWGRGFSKEALTEMPERSFLSPVFKGERDRASSQVV